MELECPRCGKSTAIHCSNDSCTWTVCFTIGCGWIYAGSGVIPTWERYAREQGTTS